MQGNFVYQQLKELQLAMFFQQDSTPPHSSLIVHVSLNQHFTNWRTDHVCPISRVGQITGYHTLIFSYGDMKKTVYQTLVAIINNLKDRIAAAIATIDADML